MVLVAFLVAFIVTPIASGLVYLDGIRRDLAGRKRLLWALVVGFISFNGFLLPHLSEDVIIEAYLHGVKSSPVLTRPSEVIVLHLTIGLAISMVSVLFYWTSIRFDLGDSSDGLDTN